MVQCVNYSNLISCTQCLVLKTVSYDNVTLLFYEVRSNKFLVSAFSGVCPYKVPVKNIPASAFVKDSNCQIFLQP